MRIGMIAALVACVFGTAGAQQRNPATQPAAVRSPEFSTDHRVTFRLYAPKATEAFLRGDFLADRVAMHKDEHGLWTVTVGPFQPDIYAYEFQLDGVRVLDPNNPAMKYSSRPREASSLLEVADDKPMFYDARRVPHGTVHERWYSSKSLDTERRIHVYTPPDYEHSSTRYPVLYLLHGAGGDDAVWTVLGHANLMLDNLIADGKLQPLVVVMTYGYAYPPNDPAYDGAQQRTGFVRDLLEDVIPFVQANYRVNTDRDKRAIAGLSMGGEQAINIGLHHPELFSRVAGFSSGFVGNFKDNYKDVLGNSQKLNADIKLLWMTCGTEDRLFAPNQEFSELLKAGGIKHTFRSTQGNHTWQVWRRALHEVAPMMFPKA
ncbi:MAG: esterase [Acidobacteriia bacterium]|nr:esterase [Terriglobia bacterium]